MVQACGCSGRHLHRCIVLTGGPGAGKTAVLEMLRHALCPHVTMVQEAAGILFGGGFPRDRGADNQRATQRAIFHVQWELEAIADVTDSALTICDRGLVDGVAYWPGPDGFWDAVGITREAAFARYDAVIHLRTPEGPNGYGHQNPLRTESAAEAAVIDRRILAAWDGHPRRFLVEATPDFVAKAERAVEIVREEIPACCRPSVAKPGLRVAQAQLPATVTQS
jgi:predicted ATPase